MLCAKYATMSQPPHHQTYGTGSRKIKVAMLPDNALSCASFFNLTAKIRVLNHCSAFDCLSARVGRDIGNDVREHMVACIQRLGNRLEIFKIHFQES